MRSDTAIDVRAERFLQPDTSGADTLRVQLLPVPLRPLATAWALRARAMAHCVDFELRLQRARSAGLRRALRRCLRSRARVLLWAHRAWRDAAHRYVEEVCHAA